MELKVGSIVRYVGWNSSELGGMEGMVRGVSGQGTGCRWTVEFPCKTLGFFRYDELRVLRNYTKAFSRKYNCPQP